MATSQRQRLDLLLLGRGLAVSREQARARILAGDVAVAGQVVAKPGALITETADIAVRAGPRFVSRGGEKLAHALDHFGVDVAGVIALDAGASTGGFTDCLLQRGAAHVFAVDVGYGQLDWRLRQDPRVTVLERVNLRNLQALPSRPALATLDLSFISLRVVLGPVSRLLVPAGSVIALIKPQFEAGRREVGRGGVVRDPAVHRRVLSEFLTWLPSQGYTVYGLTASPLRGPAGNVEFLAYLGLGGSAAPIDHEVLVDKALAEAPGAPPTQT
jgi:23S rRNA (cytidine1920-2'-O)/16S rRNA (cytidine1409-2'-O)-methyltransferase